MWNGYHYNIQDSWTPSLFWAPRWFSANGYGTLTDFIEPPDSRSALVSGSFVIPVSSVVPSSWVLTSASPSLSGSLLQRFFEVFVNEKEFLSSVLVATMLTRQMFFDVSEPEYGWLVESIDPIDTLSIQTTNGTALIKRAESDLELFYSGDWRWKQDKTWVLICGLDIQQLTDTTSGSWHFIDSINRSSSASLLYMEHPVTKNWFPIHPLNIRSDGFSNYYYNGNIRFRSNSPRATKLLEEVTVYINGEQKSARRTSLFNTVDEKAMYFHLSRRYGETNETLGQTILNTSWFQGQTHRKLRSFLSAALRQGQLVTIAASASSFSIPATATGFAIKNINPWIYTSEALNVVDAPISANSSIPTIFGLRIGTNTISASHKAMMASAGVSVIRKSLLWSTIETATGVYSWTNTDTLVSEIESAGAVPYLELDFNNQLYYSSSEATYASSLSSGSRDKLAVLTQANITAFTNFALAALARYNGRGIIWEIWNEPNNSQFWKPTVSASAYSYFANRVASAMKAYYPNERICTGGLTAVSGTSGDIDYPYIQIMLDNDCLRHFDAFGIHPYRSIGDPDSAINDLSTINTMLRSYYSDKEIDVNEWGYSTTYINANPSGGAVVPESDYQPTTSVSGSINIVSCSTLITSAAWSGYFVKPTVTSGKVDPFGGLAAFELASADQPSGGFAGYSGLLRAGALTEGSYYTTSCWLKTTTSSLVVRLGPTDGHSRTFTINNNWTRYGYTVKISSALGPLTRVFQVFETTSGNVAWQIYGPQTEKLSITDAQFYNYREIAQGEMYKAWHDALVQANVAYAIWYEWINASTAPTTELSNFGLLSASGNIKPAFTAAVQKSVEYSATLAMSATSGYIPAYYTKYASGDLSCGYLRNVETNFNISSGYITYDSYTDFIQGNPYINWKIPFYTYNASTVFITENFPHEVPSLNVYFATKVDVIRATQATLKKSFNRTSPAFKWSRDPKVSEILTGLAEFDF